MEMASWAVEGRMRRAAKEVGQEEEQDKNGDDKGDRPTWTDVAEDDEDDIGGAMAD
jgi:hypothetical protein